MKVKEKTDTHYSRYVGELKTMLPKLDAFMSRCSDAIAEAEASQATEESLYDADGPFVGIHQTYTNRSS